MTDIDRFRFAMGASLIFSCFLVTPLVIPLWIFGEVLHISHSRKKQQENVKEDSA